MALQGFATHSEPEKQKKVIGKTDTAKDVAVKNRVNLVSTNNECECHCTSMACVASARGKTQFGALSRRHAVPSDVNTIV